MGKQARTLIGVYGRKISFFFSWFDDFGAADIPDIVDKRRPLFLDTHNFAMLHRAFN